MSSAFRGEHIWTESERTTTLYLKPNTLCKGILQANILSDRLKSERRKSGVFYADRVGFKVSFLKISQCRHLRDLITT